MKTKRYSEEQILYALQQTERGEKATEVRRMLGITKQPFCRRKDQHAGKRVGEIRQLKPREEENRKLKQLIIHLYPAKAHPHWAPTVEGAMIALPLGTSLALSNRTLT